MYDIACACVAERGIYTPLTARHGIAPPRHRSLRFTSVICSPSFSSNTCRLDRQNLHSLTLRIQCVHMARFGPVILDRVSNIPLELYPVKANAQRSRQCIDEIVFLKLKSNAHKSGTTTIGFAKILDIDISKLGPQDPGPPPCMNDIDSFIRLARYEATADEEKEI